MDYVSPCTAAAWLVTRSIADRKQKMIEKRVVHSYAGVLLSNREFSKPLVQFYR